MTRRLLIAWCILLEAQTLRADDLCTLPTDAELEVAPTIAHGKPNAVAMDYFVLSLTWVPEYCAETAANPKPDRALQCERNHFDFAVHGLWPNTEKAKGASGHPEYCNDAPITDLRPYKKYFCMVPSTFLLAHEWLKHGSCAFSNPDDYFAKTKTLWSKLRLPAFSDNSGPTRMSALALRKRIASMNSKLKMQPEHVAVHVSARRNETLNALREIHICYDKMFKLRACPNGGVPNDVTVTIVR